MREYETLNDAWILATDILSGSLDPNVGCALIAAIAAKLGHPSSLDVLSALAHDQKGHDTYGITAEGCIDDIFSACRQLLASSIAD